MRVDEYDRWIGKYRVSFGKRAAGLLRGKASSPRMPTQLSKRAWGHLGPKTVGGEGRRTEGRRGTERNLVTEGQFSDGAGEGILPGCQNGGSLQDQGRIQKSAEFQ